MKKLEISIIPKTKLWLIILCTFILQKNLQAETYIVESIQLNVRENPTSKSKIIDRISKGEIVESLGMSGRWIKVSVRGNIGYINKQYTKMLNEDSSISNVPTDFKSGFIYVFKYSFITIFLLLAMKSFVTTKRIKDRRHKTGYRTLPFTELEVLKFAIYACIFGAPLGVFGGLFFWLKA